MHSSTATLTALHSPYAIGVVTDRLGHYLRFPVDAHSFLVSIPGAGRVLVRQQQLALSITVVAENETGLAAAMSGIISELEQSFGRSDFRRSISLKWQRREIVPVALR